MARAGSSCTTERGGPRVREVRAARGRAESGGQSARLRELLDQPGILVMPCCFDALSAKLIERAGLQLTFMSGFSVAASKALPDTGLLSYGEMVDQLREICAAISIPVIADGDTGYGNAVNAKRTVRGYAAAGAAGIMIEDQVAPKRCGHTRGKEVVSRDEAVARMRAAVDARNEIGSDIVIVARTDAAKCVSLDEAIERANLFHELGAEITFVEAPVSESDMRRIARETPGKRLVNCLEGGDTPIYPPEQLAEMGFHIAAYPLSLVSASVRAMEQTLQSLKAGRPAEVEAQIKTFPELRAIVGFDDYYTEEARYKC
uniref:Carboxyvinyl-carboxyphosphonate phosphorylmutase n=1 Tax=Erythrolobus australicus TaxID=1077150 RepID=A0A7S1TPN7_9RHOD